MSSPTPRVSLALLGCSALSLTLGDAACQPPATTPSGQGARDAQRAPDVRPSATAEVYSFCPRGTFAQQLDRLLPSMAAVPRATMVPTSTLKRTIEPGCVLPFREDATQEDVVHVDDVIAFSIDRTSPRLMSRTLGRGSLDIGRRVFKLKLVQAPRADSEDDEQQYSIEIDGELVKYVGPKGAHFDGRVEPTGDTPLPFPFDALISGLDRCDRDRRLRMTDDGNLVEATRGDSPIWRSRWVDERQSSVVDTSVICALDDARLVWRSAIGYVVPMFAVASRRSRSTLVISLPNEPEKRVGVTPTTPVLPVTD